MGHKNPKLLFYTSSVTTQHYSIPLFTYDDASTMERRVVVTLNKVTPRQ